MNFYNGDDKKNTGETRKEANITAGFGEGMRGQRRGSHSVLRPLTTPVFRV